MREGVTERVESMKERGLHIKEEVTEKVEHKVIPLNPIRIGPNQIAFTSKAEHVGVVRSTSGNLPNILNRISSSKKALKECFLNLIVLSTWL